MPSRSKVKVPTAVRILLLGGIIGMMACDRDQPQLVAPRLTPSADVVAPARDTAPFYYYQGKKILLNTDPSRMVVSATPGAGTGGASAMARAALADIGIPTDSLKPLAQVANHSILFLPQGMTASAASAAFSRLRHDPQFRFVSHVYKTRVGDHDFIPLDRVIVRFKDGVTSDQVKSLIDSLGLVVERPPRPDSGFAAYWLTYPSDSTADPLAIAAKLDRHPLVAWADPDEISDRHIASVPGDPFFGSQFYLHNTNVLNGVPVDINVEPAWDMTTGSSSLTVAVIDEGVDVTQPDIGPALVAGYDTYAGLPGIPPSEDAYHPCLTLCTADSPQGDAHGTAVAGIIAARQNNSEGVSGVAPNVHIVSVRALRNDVGNDAAYMANGINWAWSNAHADVLNNSWSGGAYSNAIANAINSAAVSGRNGRGSVVVFAAGNDAHNDIGQSHPVNFPSNLSASLPIMAVGAIDRYGNLSYYSNTGPELSVVAPSSGDYGDVTTTDLVGSYGYNIGPSGNNNYTTTFGGTSAATPQVSGVAALLLSREPNLTASQVKSRIMVNADGWGGFDYFGYGKLNAYETLWNFHVSVDGPSRITYSGTYTWTATPSGGTGTYSNYQWQISRDNGASWSTIGSSSTSYSRFERESESFWLRFLVTSGGDVATSLPAKVTVTIDSCGKIVASSTSPDTCGK